MNTNFSVVTSEIKKVSVTITRRALWDNFTIAWKDKAWDEYSGTTSLNDVAKLLLNGDKLEIDKFLYYFRNNYLDMFMGVAMTVLDVPHEIHREIVIDDEGEKYVIRHEDIIFKPNKIA